MGRGLVIHIHKLRREENVGRATAREVVFFEKLFGFSYWEF